jgi:glycosyltransferase involved in cell wall biosynthesis
MSLFSIRAYPYPMWRLLAHLANRVIDFHICDSEASRQMALATEGLDIRKTTVIHSGCALPDLSAPVRQLPSTWVAGPRELAAISVANLRWEKAHEVLLRSAQTVVRNCPDFKLTLVGEGPRRTAIEELVQEMGLSRNVVLAGSVPDASELMPHFHFSVLSSVEESFPNAVIESMAFAVPVVATRVGGVPELVRDGVDGLLVPPGDAAALAGAMLRLLSDPGLRERMAGSARERVRDSFSVGRMVRETDSLYMRLIRPPQGGEVAR